MRDEVIIALIIVLVVASAGAGYYIGSTSQPASTETTSASSSLNEPNPDYPSAGFATCNSTQQQCIISLVQCSGTDEQLGGQGLVTWGCYRNALSDAYDCEEAAMNCPQVDLTPNVAVEVSCSYAWGIRFPQSNSSFTGYLFFSGYEIPFVGYFSSSQ
jgi:hypothetical protein